VLNKWERAPCTSIHTSTSEVSDAARTRSAGWEDGVARHDKVCDVASRCATGSVHKPQCQALLLVLHLCVGQAPPWAHSVVEERGPGKFFKTQRKMTRCEMLRASALRGACCVHKPQCQALLLAWHLRTGQETPWGATWIGERGVREGACDRWPWNTRTNNMRGLHQGHVLRRMAGATEQRSNCNIKRGPNTKRHERERRERE
jgi:hypothetical protein